MPILDDKYESLIRNQNHLSAVVMTQAGEISSLKNSLTTLRIALANTYSIPLGGEASILSSPTNQPESSLTNLEFHTLYPTSTEGGEKSQTF